MKKKNKNRVSFFDVMIMRQQGKLTTSVYHKPTFGRIYTHFDSFLTSTYKIGIIHTLVFRCFCICSDWSNFH